MQVFLLVCASLTAGDGPPAADRPRVIVVAGVAGTPEYASEFRRRAGLWRDAAAKASADFVAIGLDDTPGADDRERLREALGGPSKSETPLWLVLIGHGTYDGHAAKFNLRGPDLTDVDLDSWLKPIERPVALIDCASSSGPFLNRLSGMNRVIVTATRSGDESNYARFGEFFAGAVADPAADLDKDGQVSLLEAFLTASGRTAEFYKTRSRLATEHALIDDNGDKLGTPAEWFRGVRATRRAKEGAPLDGTRAHQLHLVPSVGERALPAPTRGRRDKLEQALAEYRERRSTMGDDEYYSRIEPLLVELARLYQAVPPPEPKP